MVINKIRLENFKKFKLLEKEFSPGINVVKGARNEIGKSTLLEGIVVALFENPKSTSSQLEGLWTWGAANKSRLQIEFHVDGEDYILEKDFNKKTLRLTAQQRGEYWDVPRRVDERLRGLLGTTSDKLFLSTCCIRQDDLRTVQSGKEEASRSMERIITGGAHGITATEALKKLGDLISDLARGLDRPARSMGTIANLQRKTAEMERKLGDATVMVKEAEKLRLEQPLVMQELEKVTEEYDRCQELLDRNKKLQEIEANIRELNEKYETIDKLISQIEQLEKEKQDVVHKLQALRGFDDKTKITGVKDELMKLDAERQTIERDLPKREFELAQVETELKKKSFLSTLASRAALMVGVLLAVAGFCLMPAQGTAAIAAGLGVVLLIMSLWARSQTATLLTKKTELQKRISDMETALRNIGEKEKETLCQIQCATRDEFDHNFSLYRELVEKVDDCEKSQRLLLQGKSYEELVEQRRALVKRLRIEEDRLTDDLRDSRLSPEELIIYQRRTEELKQRKESLERRKLEIEVQLKTAACDPEDIIRLEEELQELRERLQAEKRKLRAYELARDFIAKAKQQTLEAVHEELQQKIQDYFSEFTDGKYQKVQLKPETLECVIFSREKGDWVSPENLSGGTIDQFYLAYRLALAQLIYRDRMPPLIFDDPFYNFDSLRLARALATLKEISKRHQVIIFTLGDTYDAIADRVIELPAA